MKLLASGYSNKALKWNAITVAILLWFAILLTGRQLGAQESPAEEILSNESIIQMVQAHLSADVILEKIHVSAGHYSLSTNNLVKLKQQGVPDRVISAMLAKAAASPASVKPETAPSELTADASDAQSGTSIEKWRMEKTTNPMTDEISQVLVTTLRGTPEGNFRVGASCQDDTGLGFYIESKTPALVLKRTPVSQTITTADRLGGGQEGSISAPQSCVLMQVRVGAGPVQGLLSQWCGNDKYATLEFVGNLAKRVRQNGQALGGVVQAMSSGSANDPGAGAANLLIFGLTQLQAQAATKVPGALASMGVAQMNDVLSAVSVRVQIPLTNGDTSIVEFHPQEPTFKKYTSRCMGIAPQPLTRASDGFVLLLSMSPAARQYSGTAEGFVAALPGFFSRAVSAGGLAGHDYRNEIEHVAEAVRTCAKITPEMARSAVSISPNFALPANQLPEDPEKLGPGYDVCDGRFFHPALPREIATAPKEPEKHTYYFPGSKDGEKPPTVAEERTLYFSVRPRGRWRDGKGFDVEVYFKELAGDPRTDLGAQNLSNAMSLNANAYGIVFATIDPTPEVEAEAAQFTPEDTRLVGGPPKPKPGVDGFKYLSAIPKENRSYSGPLATFLAQIPGYLKRAESAGGLPAGDYSKELAYINAMVRTCASYVGTRQNQADPRYKICSWQYHPVPSEASSGAQKYRPLMLYVTPPMSSRTEVYLEVNVAFAALEGENFTWTDHGIIGGNAEIRRQIVY